MLSVDEALVAGARGGLAGRSRTWFVTGGAGSGKSTVCAAIGERHGIEVLDLDERLYGSWHTSIDAGRHPTLAAWSGASDPLAWQLGLEPGAFLGFHAALTAEALDRLAVELRERDPGEPLLVDGGVGSVGVLARVVGPARVACLSLAPPLRATVWTGDPDRRAFLDLVAGVAGVADPVARFLALDERLSLAMTMQAAAAGVDVFERDAAWTVEALAAAVAGHLRIGAGPATGD